MKVGAVEDDADEVEVSRPPPKREGVRFAAPDPQDAVRQLVMAAKSGDPAYLGELLDSGVPVDQMDADSNGTALMAAALSGQFSCVERLLAAGASVDASHPQFKMTAFLWAAYNGHLAVAERLVEAGADPTRCDASGLSAAELARENRQGDWGTVASAAERWAAAAAAPPAATTITSNPLSSDAKGLLSGPAAGMRAAEHEAAFPVPIKSTPAQPDRYADGYIHPMEAEAGCPAVMSTGVALAVMAVAVTIMVALVATLAFESTPHFTDKELHGAKMAEMHGRHGASGEAGEPAAEEGGPGFLTVLFLLLSIGMTGFGAFVMATGGGDGG